VHIDWSTLAVIAVVAAAASVTVVLLVSFAVVGWSGDSRRGGPDDADASGTRAVAGTALTALCLFAAGLIVCYGLYLIIA
jgi:hypothetical protein